MLALRGEGGGGGEALLGKDLLGQGLLGEERRPRQRDGLDSCLLFQPVGNCCQSHWICLIILQFNDVSEITVNLMIICRVTFV